MPLLEEFIFSWKESYLVEKKLNWFQACRNILEKMPKKNLFFWSKQLAKSQIFELLYLLHFWGSIFSLVYSQFWNQPTICGFFKNIQELFQYTNFPSNEFFSPILDHKIRKRKNGSHSQIYFPSPKIHEASLLFKLSIPSVSYILYIV